MLILGLNIFNATKKTIINGFFFTKLVFHPTAIVENKDFGSELDSDIAELLPVLFILARLQNPKNLLELGTRGGESTKVLLKVCELIGIVGRSVDLSPAPNWLDKKISWRHYVSDDINFAKDLKIKKVWPSGEKFVGIDFLFIDTSHYFSHTKQELIEFWDLLNTGALIVFHDSNLSEKPNWMLSRKLNWGWNNKRGVTNAVEDFFSISISEEKFFVMLGSKEFEFLFNVPWNNGLLAIKKN